MHPLQLRASSTDITPTKLMALAGMGGATRTSRNIRSPLETNAVLIEQDTTQVLIISIDLLYAGAALVDAVRSHAASHGIDQSNVIIVASHTHYAPATDLAKPLIGRTDDAYLDTLIASIKKLIDSVVEQPPEIVIPVLSAFETTLNINRRYRWPYPTISRDGFKLGPTMVMAPKPDGPRDGQVGLIKFLSQTGDIRAVFWKFACHPTGYPNPLDVTAEYPGDVRAAFRKVTKHDLPVIFFQGFTGDVRPNLVGDRSLRTAINTLRAGPGFGIPTLSQWQQWLDHLVGQSVDCLLQPSGKKILGKLECHSVNHPLSDLLTDQAGAPTNTKSKMLELKRVAFSDQWECLLISAEVCAPYGELFGSANTWHIGYMNDVVGYLPTTEQILEGGYEPHGSLSVMGLSSGFKPGIEDKLSDLVQQLRAKTSG